MNNQIINLWRRISRLGVSEKYPEVKKKHLTVNNQLNVVMLVFALLISLISYVDNAFIFREGVQYVGYEYGYPSSLWFIALIAIQNLILNKLGLHEISKPILSFVPLYFLLFYNIQLAEVIGEYYFWYPYAPIPFILLSILVYDRKREPLMYWANIVYNIILCGFASEILNHYGGSSLPIAEIVQEHLLFYKLAPIALGLFTFIGVYYLVYQNNKSAHQLFSHNRILKKTIHELEMTQKQLIANEKMVMLGKLSSEHSHEMNTPITALKGNLSTMINDQKAVKKLWKQVIRKMCGKEFDLLLSMVKDVVKSNKDKDMHNHYSDKVLNLKNQLSKMDIPSDRQEVIADYFISFSIHDIQPYHDLLQHDLYMDFLEIAYYEMNVDYSGKLSTDALTKAEQLIKKHKIYSHSRKHDQPIPYDIKEVIKSSVEMMRTRMVDIELILDIEEHLPVLNGFPDEIGQVVNNLLSNAIDAMGTEGVLIIRAKKQPEGIVFHIQDTGGGIKEKDMNQIFKPFYTTKAIGHGTGIGLNIAKKIVEKHNGTIQYENVDQGALFRVTLPASIQLN